MRRNPAGCEEVRGCDAAEEAPVGAVGSEADGAAEHEALSRLLDRAVGEVRGRQDLFGEFGVGRHHRRRASEAESHELVGVVGGGD